MLGRHHISITTATIVPFLIPLIFQPNIDLVLPMAFLISAFIGSLTPDADCGGKATIYYRFRVVDWVMKKVIIKPVIFVFQKIVSKKYTLEYDVKEEHRGIMHSPIGILISSFLLTMVVFLFMLFLKMISFWVLLIIFFGMFLGQFMHLLEDSCTISGINWKFPFGTKELKGKICTFQKENKKDIRPVIFQYSLGAISLVLLLGYVFKMTTIPLWEIYPLIVFAVILMWAIIIFISKTEWKFWYQDVKTLKK